MLVICRIYNISRYAFSICVFAIEKGIFFKKCPILLFIGTIKYILTRTFYIYIIIYFFTARKIVIHTKIFHILY